MSAAQELTCATGTASPNVWTWHNDVNRTGWQQNETCLTPKQLTTTNGFGLLYQWGVTGRAYAQPLAVTLNQNVGSSCTSPCNLLLVATEKDYLYAFNAANGQLVWGSNKDPVNLAGSLQFKIGDQYYAGQPINCQDISQTLFPACQGSQSTEPNPFSSSGIGVTGTPVIDMGASPPVLYVVGAVCFDTAPNCTSSNAVAGYYLFAVDITTGNVLAVTPPQSNGGGISGSVPGNAPANACTSTYPSTGTITFDNGHIQRSGLLLLSVGGTHTVYVAFADLPEIATENGWMFGYALSGGALQQVAIFATTPYGSGGGIWGSGAGPASDGTSIYLTTGNGTIFDSSVSKPEVPIDLGDSLLRIVPGSSQQGGPGLTVADWYAPSNVLTYQGPAGNVGSACTGLCDCDWDFSSGGVLVVPPPYTYSCTSGSCAQCNGTACSVVINADKQSNIYVANQANLGGYNAAGGNNIETVLTPCVYTNGPGGGCTPQPAAQGYWASPAYWYFNNGSGNQYMLYYSATQDGGAYQCPGKPNGCPNGYGPAGTAPEALNAYQLSTTSTAGPPISQTPYANSGSQPTGVYPVQFCDHSPTPSISSAGSTAGSGVVWAVEQNQNNDNLPPATGNGKWHDCAMPNANGNGTGGHPNGNPAALHAFCAAAGGTACPSAMTELYSSRGLKTVVIGQGNAFPVPTIFNGYVYIGTGPLSGTGTDGEIDVFGICNPHCVD